ncbi:flagellar hook-associated protein FlgK [Campylobacter curvus]|uniref:flagellar hook-associated protein FlgK n=1 Tax=Campylobacter curvus TaxID=200 RepID=UPI00147007E2|nr:flagellar hook-associated protein FlgK [Campylobacter curvus]
MANIFMSLNTGVSGLNAAQTQISTIGNNIANADSAYYTRQRVVQSASPAMNTVPGGVGTGTQVDTVKRIHDEFTYSRLKTASSNLENTAYKQRILQEVTKYFPDLNDKGMIKDIQEYFGAWNDFASNPDEGSQKVNLLNKASVLTSNLSQSAKTLYALQTKVDETIKINIKEINSLAKQIANLNAQIQRVEAGADAGIKINANDLRDKRDELELAMSKLVNVSSFKSDLKSDATVDTGITDQGKFYTLNIGGVNIVDGPNYHELSMSSTDTGEFTKIYYEREDGKRIPMEDKITNGKIGASLDLRGRNYDVKEQKFTDGAIQKYIDNLDTFSKTLINSTNNIYAESAVERSNSDEISYLEDDKTLMNFSNSIREGSFEAVVYDNKGNVVARKTININGTTTMNDTTYGNSIVSDFNSDSDDNNDNNMLNDVNDYFQASYDYDKTTNKGTFSLIPKQAQGLYSISLVDKGTNFPGVVGVNRFFKGTDAKSIGVNNDFAQDHTKIRAYSKPVVGNNEVANKMVQLQYTKQTFYSNGTALDRDETIEGYYRYFTTDIASDTEANNTTHDTNTALQKTAEEEFQSISGVDTNEELTNLIRFQASYGAAAKIITTVDQMLDTLLTLKQ